MRLIKNIRLEEVDDGFGGTLSRQIYDEINTFYFDGDHTLDSELIKYFLEISVLDITDLTASALELNYNELAVLGQAENSKVLTFDQNSSSIIPDSFQLKWGSDSDLVITHDGTNSLINNTSGELRISAEASSSSDILIGNSSSHVQIGQDLTASGVIIGQKDNATALRVKGAAHTNDVGEADPEGNVQSYAGIFTNDVYNQASHAGTRNTRFITGGNIGMDVVTQSAHGLHLVAGDGTQTDGEILMASKNSLKINTRVNPYAVTAPKYLQIDRVDKGTLDSNNTSNVEISVNSGNLVISSNTEIASVDLTGQSVDLNLNTNKITNLANPTENGDAANKAYVDEVAQGIIAKPSVLAATTQNLVGTYDNGIADDGVGATLNLGASATLDIDGVTTWAQYDGVLLKDQTSAFQNGRYYVSQIGDAATDWILTRCGYCDEANEIPGAYVFVASGTTNEGTGWVQVVSDPSTFVVGTDDISVYQFSSAGQVDAGAGLTKNGNVIDANVDNASIEIDVNDNLKVKSGGITSAMLAGSIANSKLNTLTVANKVALSSIDIDGGNNLASITDSDLFIVDNEASGTNYQVEASSIAAYNFGKVSGDASITSTGTLSLESLALTGQTEKLAINDNDIILLADSEDNNNLKKMTKANFVSGLATSTSADDITQGSGNIAFETSNGTLTLGSTGNIEITNASASADIDFNLNGVADSLVISSSLSNGDYTRQIRFKDGMNLRTLTTLTAEGAGGTGYPGSEIILTGESAVPAQAKSLVLGTQQALIADSYGNNSDSNLVLQSASRKFIFTDSSRRIDLSGPYPFFHIEKVKGVDTDLNTDFDIEFNSTKGVFGAYLGSNWGNFTHNTFLKANQDGQVTQIGHDTPTDGQVLTWDNANGYVVWSDSTGGIASLSEDSAPQLSANLDTDGNGIGNYSGGGDIYLVSSPGVSGASVNITNQSNEAAIRLYNRNNNSAKITVPQTISTDYTLTLPDSDGNANQVLQTDGNGALSWVNQTSGGISSLSEDSSPVLGGHLDLGGYDIRTTSLGYHINLDPNGAGYVTLKGNSTRGSGLIRFACEQNTHWVSIQGPAHSAAANYTLTLPTSNGNLNQVLRTDGNGVLSWTDLPTLGTAAILDVGTAANNVVQLDANAKLPAVDGSQLTNMHYTYSAQTTSFNAQINYHYSVNTTNSAVNISLPRVSSTGAGQQLRIKFKAGTNLLTVIPYSGDNIEGLASFVMTDSQTPGQSLDLISDGVDSWEII